MDSVWVLGDQLNRSGAALAGATPGTTRVLMVESTARLLSRRWHIQRAHLVISGMRHLAEELRAEGFEVDYRRAESLRSGLQEHRAEFAPSRVVASEPTSWDARRLLQSERVDLVRSTQFLCHPADFAEWVGGRKRLRMEDFYRVQRRRLGYLMDGDEPAGGEWNYDHDNRKPPPRGEHQWPVPPVFEPDRIDAEVLADLREMQRGGAAFWGDDPTGVWPTTRQRALAQLEHAVRNVLPGFGPYEDAMLSSNWHLAHTMLSPALNVGLLHPSEVCDAIEAAYRAGHIPIASAEGAMRQIIGWREYVWGVYWLWMPEYRAVNELDAHRPLPPVFTGAPTSMRCVGHTMADITSYGWTHHIQRLMILGNLALISGVSPQALVEWMWEGFVDGAEWVMLPNVLGMALHADGGRMATKPYASGGAYIDRMSDYCSGCSFDRSRRTGDTACPFTTLYWDFLHRHRDRFAKNPRVVQQVRAMGRLNDLDAVRDRAEEVLRLLDEGRL